MMQPSSLRRVRAGLFLVMLLSNACGDEIVHNIEEIDANRVITQLHGIGISARKIAMGEGHWSISVPSEAAVDAMRHLDSSRTLIQTRSDQLSATLIPSREDQLYRFERQISRGLEDTLRTLVGVLEARVHLNLNRSESLFGSSKASMPNSASVLLVVNSLFLTNPAEITAIVAGASGVANERVSVVINRTSAPPNVGSGVDPEAPLSKRVLPTDGLSAELLSWKVTLGALLLLSSATLLGRRLFILRKRGSPYSKTRDKIQSVL